MDKAESRGRNAQYNTPWGLSDTVWDLLPGVQWINTPSHGGLRISREYARQHFSPECLKSLWHGEQQGAFIFFEEDCDWCLAVFESPEIGDAMVESGLSEGDIHGDALRALVNWQLDYCLSKTIPISEEAIRRHIEIMQRERDYLSFIENLQQNGYNVPEVKPWYMLLKERSQ